MDLTPVAARLDWADAHAQRVRDLSAEWAGTALVMDAKPDAERRMWVSTAQVVGEPPGSIARWRSGTWRTTPGVTRDPPAAALGS